MIAPDRHTIASYEVDGAARPAPPQVRSAVRVMHRPLAQPNWTDRERRTLGDTWRQDGGLQQGATRVGRNSTVQRLGTVYVELRFDRCDDTCILRPNAEETVAHRTMSGNRTLGLLRTSPFVILVGLDLSARCRRCSYQSDMAYRSRDRHSARSCRRCAVARNML